MGITRPPLNSLAILNEAGITLDSSSPDKLSDQLYAGVYLKPNKLKYFVDQKSNKNCFVLFARELFVCHGDNPQYWKWIQEEETCGENIELAELLEVCWFEVSGRIRTINLSPGTLYEIIFVVRMTPKSTTDHISNFSVDLFISPQRSKSQTRSESFGGKPVGNWFEIHVGEFMMSPPYVGSMDFGMRQHDGSWKRGLVVKCAIIRPKK